MFVLPMTAPYSSQIPAILLNYFNYIPNLHVLTLDQNCQNLQLHIKNWKHFCQVLSSELTYKVR